MKFWCLCLLGVIASYLPARGQPTCQQLIDEVPGARPGQVYIASKSADLAWTRMNRGHVSIDVYSGYDYDVLYFPLSNASGAVNLRVSRSIGNGDRPARSVTLRREGALTNRSCSTSQLGWNPIRFFSSNRNFQQGVDVTSEEYRRFHRYRERNSDIEAFHIGYNARGRCVRTDDIESGNRGQFLFDDEMRTLSLTEALRDRVPIGPPAAQAEGVGQAQSRANVDLLRQASHAETQLGVYSAGERPCVRFSFSPPLAGSYSLRVSDLEARDNRGRRNELRFTLVVAE